MLTLTGIDPQAGWRILDIGGQYVNGSVHDYFPNSQITTLDLEHADIQADARVWRSSRKFDLVIATEVFEHVQDWQQIIATMHFHLDPHGPGVLIATCASTGRRPHGATGALDPAPGEWYKNVSAQELKHELDKWFPVSEVHYFQEPWGDAYMWASLHKKHDITVIIPTISQRRDTMLQNALRSVEAQTLAATEVIVEEAGPTEGPATVRNRALEKVKTKWVAFLDDDDLLDPNHLSVLASAQNQSGADVIWPWFRVEGGSDPFPMFRGRQWDPEDPHQIPITVLLRTSAIRAVGGFKKVEDGPTDQYGNRAGEDWRLWLDLSQAGYKFHHTPEITWTWRHHGKNTSGLPERR